ncbi:zinc finger protein 277-like [Homarus americanus]|uniref:zinc finger protein 277-like n=1 Tax=Homarus americanus TaxID=6706 RepID=UPI001C458928|nr:zinc finger protein 277-like [Homarus americanus]
MMCPGANSYGSDFAALDFDFDCDDAVPCILCNQMFTVMKDEQPLLRHLSIEHKFTIGAVEQVADLRQYVLYWGKLRDLELQDYCVVINTNSEPGAKGPVETFYLLCNKLPEDNKLRLALSHMKLKYIVEQKEKERSDISFSRKCIYCSETVTGGVTNCFHHLTFQHGFSVGNPDNIIYGAKLLDLLEEKLHKLLCLYCEKTFKTHKVLREHMRKLQHRHLNPKNKIYDKFYLRNYLRPGTPWEEAKRDLDVESDTESFSGDRGERSHHDELLWTDWREDDTLPTTCLFCHFTTTKVPNGLFHHMRVHHKFDFEYITKKFSFYQQVKIVNFIRLCMVEHRCVRCQVVFATSEILQHHLSGSDHCKLPDRRVWDLPRYHIPVFENDGLLCHLDDNEMHDAETGSCCSPQDDVMVVPEDILPHSNSILKDSRLREEINGMDSGDVYGSVMCLFCLYTASGDHAHVQVYSHMRSLHCFDFTEVMKELSFYNQVKLINYIRWKTAKSECYFCGQVFSRTDSMEEHRVLANHITLPDSELYEDKRWLQPILEEDGLLQRLREAGDSDDEDPDHPDSSRDEVVFSEEVNLPPSILSDEAVRKELLENVHPHLSVLFTEDD